MVVGSGELPEQPQNNPINRNPRQNLAVTPMSLLPFLVAPARVCFWEFKQQESVGQAFRTGGTPTYPGNGVESHL